MLHGAPSRKSASQRGQSNMSMMLSSIGLGLTVIRAWGEIFLCLERTYFLLSRYVDIGIHRNIGECIYLACTKNELRNTVMCAESVLVAFYVVGSGLSFLCCFFARVVSTKFSGSDHFKIFKSRGPIEHPQQPLCGHGMRAARKLGSIHQTIN